MNAPFPAPINAGIEPELSQPVPRATRLRPMAGFEMFYSMGCGSVLFLFGLLNLPFVARLFFGPPRVVRPGDFAIGLGAALFFGVPGALIVGGLLWNFTVQRHLVERGELRRARVEDVDITTGKNARQTYVLSWEEAVGAVRHETVIWRGDTTLSPASSAAFQPDQLVSVLVDTARPKHFVVYRFALYRARLP